MTPDEFDVHDDHPVFVISVAAQLTGLHAQTLRQYDRLGLVSPGRTSGRGRRYSARDIVLLREVARLSADGVSLVGIKRILELEAHIDALQRQVVELQQQLAAPGPGRAPGAGRNPSPRGDSAGQRSAAPRPQVGRDVVPIRAETTVVVWSRTKP